MGMQPWVAMWALIAAITAIFYYLRGLAPARQIKGTGLHQERTSNINSRMREQTFGSSRQSSHRLMYGTF